VCTGGLGQPDSARPFVPSIAYRPGHHEGGRAVRARIRGAWAALAALLVFACSPENVTEEVTEITVEDGGGQFGLLTLAILLLVVVIVALIAVVIVLVSRRPPPPPVAPPPPPPPTTPPPPPVAPEQEPDEEEWEWVDEDDPRWADAEEWDEEDEG
jgi:hypothetical protein